MDSFVAFRDRSDFQWMRVTICVLLLLLLCEPTFLRHITFKMMMMMMMMMMRNGMSTRTRDVWGYGIAVGHVS